MNPEPKKYYESKHVELLGIAMDSATSIENGLEIYRMLEDFLSGRAEKLAKLHEIELDLEAREKAVSVREKAVSEVFGPKNPRSRRWSDEHERRIMESFNGMPPEKLWPIMETIYEYMKIRKVDQYLIQDDAVYGGKRERELGETAVGLGREILNYFRK